MMSCRLLEKELIVKRSEFETAAQNRTAELDAREKAIASRENDMESLQKEVESFPKRNEAARSKGGGRYHGESYQEF